MHQFRMRPLCALIPLIGTLACEEDIVWTVEVQPSRSIASAVPNWRDFDPEPAGEEPWPTPIPLGRLYVSRSGVPLEPIPGERIGPLEAGDDLGALPFFRDGCFSLRLTTDEADRAFASGTNLVDLGEFNESAFYRTVYERQSFYLEPYFHRSYRLPNGETVNLESIANGDSFEGVRVDDRRIIIDCRVDFTNRTSVLEINVSGPGIVNGTTDVMQMWCDERKSPCALIARFQPPEFEVSVDEGSFDAFVGFTDAPSGDRPCPLADQPLARQMSVTEGGQCLAVFDGWASEVQISPSDVGAQLVALTDGARISPSDPGRVQVLSGQLDAVEVRVESNGFPYELVSAVGDCQATGAPGTVRLSRPTAGRGSCAVEVDPDPGSDFLLSFAGATAPDFEVAPSPLGETLACEAVEDEPIRCTDPSSREVALPLRYDAETPVTLTVAETEGRIVFDGDCAPGAGRSATLTVGARSTCAPRVFHRLDLVAGVEVELDPGPDGGPATLCAPGIDGVDCDRDGQDDVVEYPYPTQVTLTAQEPADFSGGCTESDSVPEASLLAVEGKATCQIDASGAPADARLAFELGADDGDPASRVRVLDPDTKDEVDRCAYDAASGYAGRSCVLTGLPRTMLLAPEGDGDGGGTSYADFVRFEGDCAPHLVPGADGYTFDINQALRAGEAPSNNQLGCTAIFGCTPDAVLETIDVELFDGATSVASFSVDVASDCELEGGIRYDCRNGPSVGVPENTPLDVVSTVSGGAPGVFEELFFPLDFTALTTPRFEKTATGDVPIRLQLGGCEHFYQISFTLQ